MRLEDCTKEELVGILNKLKDHGNETLINFYLLEVSRDREVKELHEAANWAKISASFRKKYIELLKPYEGRPINEIPQRIREVAATYQKAGERADKKIKQLLKNK